MTNSRIIRAGAEFGELALLHNEYRLVTIEAEEDCEVYSLDGRVFKSLIVKNSIERRTRKVNFLDKIKLFENLSREQKLKLIDGL